MMENDETLEQVRGLLAKRELTGQVVLHCFQGRVEKLEIREAVDAPWRARLKAAQERTRTG